MYKAVIFDYGGVFIDSPFAALDEVAPIVNTDENTLREIVFGDYCRDGDHPWHRLERGEITLEETRNQVLEIGQKQGLQTDIYELLAKFVEVERMVKHALIDYLPVLKRRGLKLALLTNNIKEFTTWKDIFPFVITDVFDAVVDSSEIGMRKPNPDIFRYTLDALNVDTTEALFLDDFSGNTDAATDIGIKSFTVSADVSLAVEWIEELTT